MTATGCFFVSSFAEIAVKHPHTPRRPGRNGLFDLQPRFFIFRVNKNTENYLFKLFYFSTFVEFNKQINYGKHYQNAIA